MPRIENPMSIVIDAIADPTITSSGSSRNRPGVLTPEIVLATKLERLAAKLEEALQRKERGTKKRTQYMSSRRIYQ